MLLIHSFCSAYFVVHKTTSAKKKRSVHTTTTSPTTERTSENKRTMADLGSKPSPTEPVEHFVFGGVPPGGRGANKVMHPPVEQRGSATSTQLEVAHNTDAAHSPLALPDENTTFKPSHNAVDVGSKPSLPESARLTELSGFPPGERGTHVEMHHPIRPRDSTVSSQSTGALNTVVTHSPRYTHSPTETQHLQAKVMLTSQSRHQTRKRTGDVPQQKHGGPPAAKQRREPSPSTRLHAVEDKIDLILKLLGKDQSHAPVQHQPWGRNFKKHKSHFAQGISSIQRTEPPEYRPNINCGRIQVEQRCRITQGSQMHDGTIRQKRFTIVTPNKCYNNTSNSIRGTENFQRVQQESPMAEFSSETSDLLEQSNGTTNHQPKIEHVARASREKVTEASTSLVPTQGTANPESSLSLEYSGVNNRIFQYRPEIPVGGRLTHFVEEWSHTTNKK